MNKDFLWGSATASYQCEGAWNLDDKVESMWDVYLHENNLENGDNASDFYHHFEEDLLKIRKVKLIQKESIFIEKFYNVV